MNLCLEEIRPVKVLSSPNVEEKFCIFSLCWMPRKGLYRASCYFEPISFTKILHQVLKLGTWEVTNIAKRRIKHHPFRHCLSRFFTSDDDLQCVLYSTLSSARFQRIFLRNMTQNRYNTAPYCAHDMTCRSTTSWIMELRLGPKCTVL